MERRGVSPEDLQKTHLSPERGGSKSPDFFRGELNESFPYLTLQFPHTEYLLIKIFGRDLCANLFLLQFVGFVLSFCLANSIKKECEIV